MDFEDIFADLMKTRAEAIDKFLAKNGIDESSEDFTISSTFDENGSEIVNLWKLEKVASLKLDFSVRAGKPSE